MPGLTQTNEDNLMAAIDAEEQKGAAPATEQPQTEPQVTPADDPEVDLGGEKVKRSQILEWKKNQLLQSDYTKKTQELAQQRKELDELVKFADYLKANPTKLQKVLAALEDKAESIQAQQQQVQTDLQGLDPNDPYAKLLQAKFDALQKMIQPLQDKLTQFEQQSKETHQQQMVAQAQQVLSTTLDETFKGLKFIDDGEKSICKQMVLSFLKDNPREYADETEFKTTISDVAKKQYDALQKVGEARVKQYLESKKATPIPPATGVQGQVMQKKPTFSNLEDILQQEFQKESE